MDKEIVFLILKLPFCSAIYLKYHKFWLFLTKNHFCVTTGPKVSSIYNLHDPHGPNLFMPNIYSHDFKWLSLKCFIHGKATVRIADMDTFLKLWFVSLLPSSRLQATHVGIE